MAVVALAAGCAHVARPGPQAAADPTTQEIPLAHVDDGLLARAIFEETNRVRLDHGLPPLAALSALDAAAGEQASYMALICRAEHANPFPGEHTVTERVAHEGLLGSRVGENAIMMPAQRPADSARRDYTYAALADYLVAQWMDSPAHRANLLDPRYTHLGCAARIARGVLPGNRSVFATQVFFQRFSRDPSEG
jgi:uncharacterized protein YkwD